MHVTKEKIEKLRSSGMQKELAATKLGINVGTLRHRMIALGMGGWRKKSEDDEDACDSDSEAEGHDGKESGHK